MSTSSSIPGFPLESHYATIDGVRLHYVDEGEGPPILMFHVAESGVLNRLPHPVAKEQRQCTRCRTQKPRTEGDIRRYTRQFHQVSIK